MKSTRQRMIDYLQRRQLASAVDISHALHLTAADIRHHLTILSDEGVVNIVSERSSSGRGRPTALYQLAKQAQANNLNGLTSALLLETQASVPDIEQHAFNKRLAQRLAGSSYSPVRNPTQRFLQAVQHLNQMNYQARWEAHSDTPQVIITHCPYASVLSEHPEVCQIDVELLSVLLASPVKQIACHQLNPQGVPQCIFVQK
jgi:predicted ArsR family transcriptional regulator